jgi:hypothetical protein
MLSIQPVVLSDYFQASIVVRGILIAFISAQQLKLTIMKKHFLKFFALLIFASAISSCSIEYRQRHMHHDHDYNNSDHHDHN